MKQRLDQKLVQLGLARTRSQAETLIKLGEVVSNGKVITKPGQLVDEASEIKVQTKERYVSRAALKLASVSEALGLDFADKTMLDVGSSTGGFTDYALQHGAKKVVAVEVGTDQLHVSLRSDERIELHEKTDIRDVWLNGQASRAAEAASRGDKVYIDQAPDIVVADVSFISLRDILPHIAGLMSPGTLLIAMVKPQFEAGKSSVKHKGVIKNDKLRREILKDFEIWAHQYFVVADKADSAVSGEKGNQERFYCLKKL